MPSNRPTLLSVLLVALAVPVFGALTSAIVAQTPPSEFPLYSVGAADQQVTPAAPPSPVPATEVFDREAIQTIVRDELEAEKARAAQVGSSDADAGWTEIGKDRSLEADWVNGFVAESADKSFRFHIGGRMEFDNCWFSQDGNLLIGPSEDTEMRDGTLFRRARLRSDGRLWEFIDYA
jgi:hypothetical protein